MTCRRNFKIPNTRLSKVRSVEIELSACDVIGCADHPEKDWQLLEGIYNHLGSNLEEMIVRGFWCGFPGSVDGPAKDGKWIKTFAEEKQKQGVNICIVWASTDDDGFRGGTFDYYWAEAASDRRLLNFLSRTVWGLYPRIRIWGLPGQHIPNVLVRLTNLLADRFPMPFMTSPTCRWLYSYFKLETNTKMKKLENLEDDRSCCVSLRLLNKDVIEDEEVLAMEAFLANMAKNSRPTMPRTIIIPKVNS